MVILEFCSRAWHMMHVMVASRIMCSSGSTKSSTKIVPKMIKQRHYQHLNIDKGILSILYKSFTPNHSLLHIFSHIRIKEKLSKTIKSMEECISKSSFKHIRKQPLFLAKISIAIVSIILHAFFKFDWLVSF
jgi:hypothetical protein